MQAPYREDVGSMAGTVADLTGEIGNFAAHKAQLEEQYQEQVQALESQLKREYQEPIYLDAQFNPSLQAANAIIKSLYQDMGIAVEGMGGSVDDGGLVRFGILPSFSLEGEALAKQINQRSKNLAQSLKLGQAPKARYCPEFRAIEIVFRRDVKPVADVPPRFVRQAFPDLVKALTMPNVPAIRLMGESGAGKSSLTRLILSEHHKNQPSLILLHDPQADTDEDRWGIEKASDTADLTAKALKKLAVDVENKVRLTNRTFYVFDELDGQCQKDRDVKKALLTIAKKARHIKGLYVLFLGQSSNVGRVGLEWVDMSNFAAIYIGESALHAIEKSPKLVNIQAKLKGQYHEISEWCECKDKMQFIDSHEAHAHRFALVVIPGKEPYWELLPSFTEGIEGYTKPLPGSTQIVPESAQSLPDVAQVLPDETLKALVNRLPDRLPDSPMGSLPCPPVLPTCPTCGSQDLASRGVQWGCKSCRKRFNKEVKK